MITAFQQYQIYLFLGRRTDESEYERTGFNKSTWIKSCHVASKDRTNGANLSREGVGTGRGLHDNKAIFSSAWCGRTVTHWRSFVFLEQINDAYATKFLQHNIELENILAAPDNSYISIRHGDKTRRNQHKKTSYYLFCTNRKSTMMPMVVSRSHLYSSSSSSSSSMQQGRPVGGAWVWFRLRLI